MTSGFRNRTRALAGLFTAALALLLSTGWSSPAVAADITPDNVAEHIASAKTAADHEALAAYYRKQAAEQEKRVKRHQEMLERYKAIGGKQALNMKLHCQAIIYSGLSLQTEYEGLAASHEQMAKDLSGK